jgi:signal transduction histidine kinase
MRLGQLVKPLEIFCCYARKDQPFLNDLRAHLIPLQRQDLIKIWADTDIGAGTEWEGEIERHLDTANIVLLLVSPDFMVSDYCYSKELKRAMERHERGNVRVIPIILRPTMWKRAPFGKLQALPNGAIPVTSWNNRDEAFISIAEDIRKVTEDLLTICAQEADAEPQNVDKLKDEFIVKVSHKMRTPLSAISGYSLLLKRQSGRLNPKQILRFASKIDSSAQQLSDLVANMTEAAKMGAQDKKLDLQVGPVQVLAQAELATTLLSVNIEQEISLFVAPHLWVIGDALRLRQVLTNLLDNAAKYSPPTGRIRMLANATTLAQLPLPEDEVDFTLLADGDRDTAVVHVCVCDEGDGIPPQDQQNIFEKFVRTPSSLQTPLRGSGLGLYICRSYIESMGGKLWLERSVPGEGSVFGFYLLRIDTPIEVSEQDESDSDI